MKTRALNPLSVVGFLLVSGCRSQPTASPNFIVTENLHSGQKTPVGKFAKPIPAILRSGKSVPVVGLTEFVAPPAGEMPSFYILYRTRIPTGRPAALLKEAEEVRQYFEKQAISSGFSEIVVTSEESESGQVSDEKNGFTFGWKRNPKGKWERLFK